MLLLITENSFPQGILSSIRPIAIADQNEENRDQTSENEKRQPHTAMMRVNILRFD